MLTDYDAPALPPQQWSWKKILLGLLGLLTAFLIAILAYDTKLEPYDDLLPSRTTVPDAETNGYLFLRDRWDKLPELDNEEETTLNDMVSGKASWDGVLVAKLRSGRETAASDLKAALALPFYLTPPILTIRDPELSLSSSINRPVRYLAMEVIALARADDPEAALSLISDLHTLATRHVQGSGSLISLLVGITMHSTVAKTANELLELGKLNSDHLAILAGLWKDDLPALQSWQEAMRSEAAFGRDAILTVADMRPGWEDLAQPKISRLLFKRNQTLNRNNQKIRHVSRIAFQTFPSQSAAESAGWGETQDERSKLKRTLDLNYAGNKLTEGDDSFGRMLGGITNKMLFEPRAMRTKIALHRWRLSHPDQWPVSLEELVPNLLTEVPKDPFNGEPLLWDPVAGIISSVGSDWQADPPKPGQPSLWFSMDHDAPMLPVVRPPGSPPP